jgi:hypothetical protein
VNVLPHYNPELNKVIAQAIQPVAFMTLIMAPVFARKKAAQGLLF